MNLFIANCTKQNHDFAYMIPSFKTFKNVPIPVGTQIKLTNLAASDIDQITKQHAKYGMVRADEVDRTKPFIGLCYDIDRPVKLDKMLRILDHNEDLLVEAGQDTRRAMAIRLDKEIKGTLREHRDPATLENLETHIEQIEGTGDPQKRIEGEGIIVRQDGTDPNKMVKTKKKPASRNRESV